MRMMPIYGSGPHVADEMPRLLSVWRLEETDAERFRYQHFFSSASLAWRPGRDNRYRSNLRRDEGLERVWGFLFEFHDGTWGGCQVRHVNQALDALGWRLDLHAELPEERR